jgi:hypothetical protein
MWIGVRTLLAAVVLAGGVQASRACDVYYPEDFVWPTPADLVRGSTFAFVGRVVGYRFDDGSILEQDITCEGVSGEDFFRCWDERQRIVNAILSVEEPIRGMGDQALFEDTTSAESGADCGNQYEDGGYYLVTDYAGGIVVVARYLATPLSGAPSEADLRSWRSLPPAEPR